MDTRTPLQRSRIMKSVGTKDTIPELKVRRLLFKLGYRYILHCKKLPGKPDIVFTRRKKAIFVHGCFWHGHDCVKGKLPKSRLDYWEPKIAANKLRDERIVSALAAEGWQTFTVWQCQLDEPTFESRLVSFLGNA